MPWLTYDLLTFNLLARPLTPDLSCVSPELASSLCLVYDWWSSAQILKAPCSNTGSSSTTRRPQSSRCAGQRSLSYPRAWAPSHWWWRTVTGISSRKDSKWMIWSESSMAWETNVVIGFPWPLTPGGNLSPFVSTVCRDVWLASS